MSIVLTLAEILAPLFKDGTVSDFQVKITGEERPTPKGVWVQGGGIQLSAKFFIYGLKKNKGKVGDALRQKLHH